MGAAGAIVAAAALRREREIVAYLREAGAVSAETAKPYARADHFGGAVFDRLVRSGSIRKVEAGVWLDEAAYAAQCAKRAKVQGWVVVVGLGVFLLVMGLGILSPR